MSSDDRVRGQSERRKELNRQAAQKLRNHQKEKAVTAKQDYFNAQSRHTQLIYEVKQLRKKKEALKDQLDNHLPTCHKITNPSATLMHSAQQSAQAYVKQEVATDLSSLLANSGGLTPVLIRDGNSVTVQLFDLNNVVNSTTNRGLIEAFGLGTAGASAVQSESEITLVDANSKIQMYSIESDGVGTPTLMMEVEQQSSADENDANDEVESDQASIVIATDELDNDDKDCDQLAQTENADTVVEIGNENQSLEKQTEQGETADCDQGTDVDNVMTYSSSVETSNAASPAKQEKVTRSSSKQLPSVDSNSSQENDTTGKSLVDCPLPVTVSSLIADD